MGVAERGVRTKVTRIHQTRHLLAGFRESGRNRARLVTGLAILGLCSFAVVRGWSIVRFVDARAHLDLREARVEAIRSWVGLPGLSSTALQESLTQINDATDVDGARKRADELSALLSVRPLSSVNWLALGGMRLVTGQPEKEVLSALEMSWVTGPNEGSVMLQRGTFGLLLWEALPSDARRRVIDDIVGALLGTPVDNSELALARNVLTAKSVDARLEITSRMQAESLSATQLARLGL